MDSLQLQYTPAILQKAEPMFLNFPSHPNSLQREAITKIATVPKLDKFCPSFPLPKTLQVFYTSSWRHYRGQFF
jgi:hypothetical protein